MSWTTDSSPASPRRPRLFYGWYVVAAAFLGLFVSSGSTGFAFSVFIPPMVEDLGWSRSALVGVTGLAWVIAALSGPWLGRIVDVRGPRLPVLLSVLGLGVALSLSSLVYQPWHLYLTFGLLGGLCRAILQTVAPTSMVAQWFIRRRSTAYSIVSVGPPAAHLVYAPLTAFIVATWGWRAGWLALGASVLLLALAPAVLVRHRRPEDAGLLPDGVPGLTAESAENAENDAEDGEQRNRKNSVSPSADSASSAVNARGGDEDWTLSEALREPAFWRAAFSLALLHLSPATAVVFLFSYLRAQGLSDGLAAATISGLSVFQVVSRAAFWGVAIARLGSVQKVMLLWGIFVVAATVALALAPTGTWAVIASLFLGFAMGGNLVLQLQIWPEYFGRRAIGAISGAGQLVLGLSLAGGPLISAAVIDATGSYTTLLLGLAVLGVAGILLQFGGGRPRRPPIS